MIRGLIHLGIVRKINKSIVHNICLGLGGLGTNTFKNAKDKEDYQMALMTGFQKVLRKSVEDNMQEINSVELDFKNKPIEKCISEWMRHQESNGNINDVNLHRIMEKIKGEYSADISDMTKLMSNFNGTQFLTDMQKIDTLYNYLKTSQIAEISPMVKDLGIIINAHDAYKTAIIHSLAN